MDDINFSQWFYYYSLCHTCKKYVKTMKTCSRCKTVVYCCKDHQIKDWKIHKNLCKAIASAESILANKEVSCFKDFHILHNTRCTLWEQLLNRKLEPYEIQMSMFPKVCAVCYSKDVKYVCLECLNCSYCSDEHKIIHEEQHQQHCRSLKLCMEVDISMTCGIGSTDINFMFKGFDDKITNLPSNIEEFIKLCDGHYSENTHSERIYNIRKYGLISPITTILYCLEKTGLVKNRHCMKKNLVIHIVGANDTEMALFRNVEVMYEMPSQYIKNIESILYYFIGPELNYDDNYEKFTNRSKIRNVKTTCKLFKQLYHNIIKSIEKPDIVVCFNSGLHENLGLTCDIWKESVDSLTEYFEVPLLLTSYTEDEILKDVAIIESNPAVRSVAGPQKNPFSDMLPIRDFDNANSPVFYRNGYLAILMKIFKKP